MISTKLKSGALVGALVVIGFLILFQQRQVQRLSAENAGLRNQLSQMASLQDNNEQLAEELKATTESSQAHEDELLRLRGQGPRQRQLEQDNAPLNAQLQHLEQQIREAHSANTSGEQPPGIAATLVVSTNAPNLDTADLGLLELEDGIPVRFDLGGGTNCVVTPQALPDGSVTVGLKTELTNTDGTSSELAAARITTKPGQHASISVGDRMVALAVKFK